MRCAPACDLLCRFSEYPVPDVDDQPGFFCDGNELVRADEASGRVLPADQRFRFVDDAALQIYDGLVVNPELLSFASRIRISA